jgi:hypothetical protein
MMDEPSGRDCLLIIQCDSGHINLDLIACARYRIYDIRAKVLLNNSKQAGVTHVVFVINLPVKVAHPSFVGFQGDPWVSCHIDQLRPSKENAITPEMQEVSISDLFYGGLESEQQEFEQQTPHFSGASVNKESEQEELEKEQWKEEEIHNKEIIIEGEEDTENSYSLKKTLEEERETVKVEGNHLHKIPMRPKEKYTQCVRLNGCIQAAASRLQDSSSQNKQRIAERVRLLMSLVPHKPTFPLGEVSKYFIHNQNVFHRT